MLHVVAVPPSSPDMDARRGAPHAGDLRPNHECAQRRGPHAGELRPNHHCGQRRTTSARSISMVSTSRYPSPAAAQIRGN